jgi:hypothetical protein
VINPTLKTSIAAAATQYAAQRTAEQWPNALDAHLARLVASDMASSTVTDQQSLINLSRLVDSLGNPFAPSYVIGTLNTFAALSTLTPQQQQDLLQLLDSVNETLSCLRVSRRHKLRKYIAYIQQDIAQAAWTQAQQDLAYFVPLYLYTSNCLLA